MMRSLLVYVPLICNSVVGLKKSGPDRGVLHAAVEGVNKLINGSEGFFYEPLAPLSAIIEHELDLLDSYRAAFVATQVPDLDVARVKQASMVEAPCFGNDFLFLQPPHTGTVAVQHALSMSFQRMNVTPCTHTLRHRHDAGHRRYSFTKAGWAKWSKYVTFAFARDPWSRVVSCAAWEGAIDGPLQSANRTAEENIQAFRAFVINGARHKTLCPYMPSIIKYTHGRPPGEVEQRQVVTYIGRTSELDAGYKHVCELIGIPADRCVDISETPGHCVSSCCKGRPPKIADYYDAATRDIVAELYKDDIDAFGFVLEL